jgi:Ca2+:H+ antiporter
VLLAVYAAALLFSLRTHRHLLGGGHEGPVARWTTRRAVWTLLGAGVATGVVSEVLVGSVEEVGHAFGVGPVFMGVVVIAVLGNAAEHTAAVLLAWKNHMDAALSICLASSLQVALFVTPVLVLLSVPLGHPMTLVFSGIEVVAVAVAVGLTGLLTLNGESNWLEGVQLLALYVILAICLALLPAGEALLPL